MIKNGQTQASPFTAVNTETHKDKFSVGLVTGWLRLSWLCHVSSSLLWLLSASACLVAKHSWRKWDYFCDLSHASIIGHISPTDMSTPLKESQGSIKLFWSWPFQWKVISGNKLSPWPYVHMSFPLCLMNVLFPNVTLTSSSLYGSPFLPKPVIPGGRKLLKSIFIQHSFCSRKLCLSRLHVVLMLPYVRYKTWWQRRVVLSEEQRGRSINVS